MPGRVRELIERLDDRTGFPSLCRHLLSEQIPRSAGWPHVFGSTALFLFATQALTGTLLAFNLAPTPGDSYRSLLYILRKVAGGRMIIGLHHWGASLMVVVVFFHLAQVFIYGAYRKPREATWLAGVLLLLATLAFGLTGYLLPWDNRAYWGTVVTTRIIGSVPGMGSMLLRLLAASEGIGVLTYARFYALHTLLLPAATVLCILIHVYLVKRHGITPARQDCGDKKPFHPSQSLRDMVAIFIAFSLLFLAAALVDVPLERLADPTDTTYEPRPEWYFLWLFQLLRVFQGSLELIGTVVLPTAAVLSLFLLPFLQTRYLPLLTLRGAALGVVVIVLVLWGSLTATAVAASYGRRPASTVAREALQWAQLPPEAIAGVGYFHSSHCDACHNLLRGGPRPGPNLASANVHHPKEWLIQHFKRASDQQGAPSLSLVQLNSLAQLVGNLLPDTAALLATVPSTYIKGVQTYVEGGCGTCHKVNGIGGALGPPLNGVANRRSREWIEAHFVAPQRLSPGSIMPPYRFTPDRKEAIFIYLLSLHE